MNSIFQPPASKPWIILVLLAGLVWVWFSRSNAAPPDQTTSPALGFHAPQLILQNSGGEPVSLEGLKGKAVIINFWASWCPPCRAEMPALQHIQETYRGEDLVILAVNAANQDDRQAAENFVQEMNLTFPILFDLNGAASRDYQVQSLPTTFFIDKYGIIQEIVIGGPMAEALLKIRAERLIEGKNP